MAAPSSAYNTMASDVCWNNLPSVVLLEIFKRITHEERIKASATCKEWRKALYFPNFWRELTIEIYSKKEKENAVERCKFFTRSFMSSVRNVKIIFSYDENVYLSQLANALAKLAGNHQLGKLFLYNFERPKWDSDLSCCVTSLKLFLEKTKNLETFYLSQCWYSLLENDSLKLSLERQKESLKCLSLGAAYCDNLSNLPTAVQLPINLPVFQHLVILSLDHSWISDDILNQICDLKSIKRLITQLNGEYKGQEVEHESWQHFRQCLPNCELRINLVLGINEDVMKVFNESMPATHIKILYCDKIDLSLLTKFCSYRSLKSVWCLAEDGSYAITLRENPFVICSWACKELEELVLFGIQFDYEDLFGIGRVASPKLKRIDVSETSIIKLLPINNNEWEITNLEKDEMRKFALDMSKQLKRPWTPADASLYKKSNLSSYDNKICNIINILSQDFQY